MNSKSHSKTPSDPPDKNSLWQFIDEEASFRVVSPHRVSGLYFPLANEAGILSSITPDLHGDIKTGQNTFLLRPVTIEDLHNTKSSRNFWVFIEGKGAWSLAGVSAAQEASKQTGKNQEKVVLEAGALWHKVTRENAELGLKSEVTHFAPVSHDPVEIMIVGLTNTGKSTLKVTPTSAIPIFGKSADNLRDHYHVTTLLQRIIPHPAGVITKPTMSFDERGHQINETFYCVLGVDGNGEFPVGAFPIAADFIGEGGSFEAPRVILQNLPAARQDIEYCQGKPAIGALRFKTHALAPRQRVCFILLLGITRKESEPNDWIRRFGSLQKAENALKENKTYWSARLNGVLFKTHNKLYDGWVRWVSLQPILRKFFGCSFLPDFDYGRGGKGWRDLWQDCLALLLHSPQDAKKLLLNNFDGIRIDGSNATIIGSAPGEFAADRNNITRTWMDHGVWPYLTLELYIHQTGDLEILFQNAPYFRDRQLSRAGKKDAGWNENSGKKLKDKKGGTAQGSILEHLLVQHLVQFYNVGEHNHIRLENADWNDGLDMAYERGESAAFTCLYASNLSKLASLLEEVRKKTDLKKTPLLTELLPLLDRAGGRKVDYNDVHAKRKRLEEYFESTQPAISGKTIQVPLEALIEDLRQKSEWITHHVRQKEWIQTRLGEGFYNGYYDNAGRRVEGDFPQGVRMTLTGQVFPVMSGVAASKQVEEICRTARKYLKDKEHGGFRLNTDFREIQPNLGRAFSFVYGEKENGAFFNHMIVMFANALYQRNFVNEGREVLDSIFRMCVRDKSKIYPGIPEYFNSEGRGRYHYLTGSASWLILTLLTQVFGVRGSWGDLLLAPKFTPSDFEMTAEVSVDAQFAGKKITVAYRNPKKIGYEHYSIAKVVMNGKELKNVETNQKEATIKREFLLKHGRKSHNTLIVTLL